MGELSRDHWIAAESDGRSPSGAVWIVDGANVVGSRPDGWWHDRPGAAGRLYARLSATFGGVDTTAGGTTTGGTTGRRTAVRDTTGPDPGRDDLATPETRPPATTDTDRNAVSPPAIDPAAAAGAEPVADPAAVAPAGPAGEPVAAARPARPRVRVVLVLEGAARSGVPAGPGPVTVVHAPGNGDDTIVEVARAEVARAEVAVAADGVTTGGDRSVLVVTADRGLRARITQVGASSVGPGWLWERIDPSRR